MSFSANQIRLFAGLFVSVVALLAGLWFFVLRTEYVPAYQNIRENDASQIVAELENAGIAYRLENDGHDILVPENMVPKTRVAVAGANISMGGTTGFELFNENDLGLTEFAQKINLQRAIQGELARTIMMMEGVEFARVHLALPERTLFRAERETPTAAVTVEMRPSFDLLPASVRGIRQLVASSVPGLAIDDVAVLDQVGGLVSTSAVTSTGSRSIEQSEREAVESLLLIRAREAISKILPQQPFDIDVSVYKRLASTTRSDAAFDKAEQASPKPRPLGLSGRSLRVLVRTPQNLGPEEHTAITDELVEAVQLSPSHGDVLDFSTGALTTAQLPAPTLPTKSSPSSKVQEQDAATNWQTEWSSSPNISSLFSSWFLIPLILLLLALFAARPRRQLSSIEAESFAEMLSTTSLDLDTK